MNPMYTDAAMILWNNFRNLWFTTRRAAFLIDRFNFTEWAKGGEHRKRFLDRNGKILLRMAEQGLLRRMLYHTKDRQPVWHWQVVENPDFD